MEGLKLEPDQPEGFCTHHGRHSEQMSQGSACAEPEDREAEMPQGERRTREGVCLGVLAGSRHLVKPGRVW